jgi:hypothetical protein
MAARMYHIEARLTKKRTWIALDDATVRGEKAALDATRAVALVDGIAAARAIANRDGKVHLLITWRQAIKSRRLTQLKEDLAVYRSMNNATEGVN